MAWAIIRVKSEKWQMFSFGLHTGHGRPYRKKDVDILERVRRRAAKMIQKLRDIRLVMPQ